MRRALLLGLAGGLAIGAAEPPADLPAASLPPPEQVAVMLTAGDLHAGPDPTAAVRTRLAAGQIVAYLGETTDPFGRAWSVVGDPGAYRREQQWLVMADVLGGAPPTGVPLAFLQGLGAPPESTETVRRAVRVASGWWRQVRPLTLLEPPRFGELLGVPAYRVSRELAEEALGLVGGREILGPWPEDPVLGQIHVAPRLPLVWVYRDGWELGEQPRLLSPVLGLLPNPTLVIDTRAPREPTGLTLPCWRLIGALDPAGAPVGRIGEAPDEPARVPGSVRPVDPLGATDLSGRAWPVTDEEAAAPRRILVQGQDPGVELADNSTRQAVYLEQVLPAATTSLLRGRELRLRVLARATTQGESTSSVPVSIELIAGAERVAQSVQVGRRATPLTVTATVPQDAESIVVRLIPQDRSIAVPERGTVVFDSVSLAPSDWPIGLTPDPLPLRRALIVGYSPARGYTRAPVAVSERTRDELEASWRGMEGSDRDEDTRRRILAGELRVGMSGDDVRLAWGEPLGRTRGGNLERWEWPDRSAAFREDGSLITWARQVPQPEILPQPCTTPLGTVLPAETDKSAVPSAAALPGNRS